MVVVLRWQRAPAASVSDSVPNTERARLCDLDLHLRQRRDQLLAQIPSGIGFREAAGTSFLPRNPLQFSDLGLEGELLPPELQEVALELVQIEAHAAN